MIFARKASVAVFAISLLFAPLAAFAQQTVTPEQLAALRAALTKQLAASPQGQQLTAEQISAIVTRMTTPKTATTSPQAATSTSGLTNCFDYYHFGSVQADLSVSSLSAIAGSPLTFSGQLVNQNPYPLVDGTLYIKIFRYATGSFDAANGPDVVDQFVALDNVSIPAHGSVPVSVAWQIPANSPAGSYGAAAYFITDHKFNVLGLSFSDDVAGNIVRFSVGSEQHGAVGFVKNAVTANGAAYHFAQFPPQFGTTTPIAVAATIANATGQAVSVPVTWELYSWDAQDPQNLITKTQSIESIPAGRSAAVSYTITDTSRPVYLLVGTAEWQGTKSIINVRVVRPSVDRLRINFPGTATYPLQAGEPNVLFSCFHNESVGTVADARLDLTLVDEKGNAIESYTYHGGASGNMLGYAQPFTPSRSYPTYDVIAKLYQGTTLVDEVTVHYDCKAIDPASCPRDRSPWPIAAAAAVVLVIGGAYVINRRHHASV